MNEFWTKISPLALSGIFITLAAYWFSLKLYRKSKRNPLLQPIVVAASMVVVYLLATDLSYQAYFNANIALHWMLGPATIALAIPLYQNGKAIRRLFLPLLCTLIIGSSLTVGIALFILQLFAVSDATIISMATKSITTPIAMALTDSLGGIAAISAVMVIATGALGAIAGPPLLSKMGVKEEAIRGVTLGITAHAIGTARALEENHKCGAFSALAMGLNGVLTALILPWLIPLFIG